MNLPSPLHKLNYPHHNIFIKRDDLIHPIICGNKRRKLSGYLHTHFPDTVIPAKAGIHSTTKKSPTRNSIISSEAEKSHKDSTAPSSLQSLKSLGSHASILTFGGAYSNHLRATAHTGQRFNIPTIGIVRGEELAHKPLNDNLRYCTDQGMKLHFVDRNTYRNIKKSTTQDEIQNHISLPSQDTLIIPEGGCGPEGIIGTHDIIQEIADQLPVSTPVYFCIEAGTGTTAAGCIQAINKLRLNRNTIITPVLHDTPTITQTIETHNLNTNIAVISSEAEKSHKTSTTLGSLQSLESLRSPTTIVTGYEHGGYAKTTPELLSHNEHRKQQHDIHIEPVYSGKLMYAIDDLISKKYFPDDATIIIYHSGY